MNVELLREVAVRFRLGIERCDLRYRSILLEDFPRGSCGDASLLLGTYLLDHGWGPFEYVLGERWCGINETSHAWIHQNGVIVDITADQFDGISDQVIAGLITPWHSSFELESRGVSDFRLYDYRTVAVLGAAYNGIRLALGEI